MSPGTCLGTTAISEETSRNKTYHKCLSMSCKGDSLICGFVWHVLKSPAANLFVNAEGFHSISAALGEARRHADSRIISILNALELSWQWKVIVFRCRAQTGDRQALSLIWIGRWFALSIRRLSVRSNIDGLVAIHLYETHLITNMDTHNYFQNHSSLLSLDGPQLVSLVVIILRLTYFFIRN